MDRRARDLLRILCITLSCTCIFSQDANSGSEKTDDELDVRLPPSITEGPKDVDYRTEDRVVLTCKAEGEPAPEFKWYKGEELVDESHIKPEGGKGVGTIIIDPASIFDEGYYQCRAKNMYGVAMSRVAAVRRANLDQSNLGTEVETHSATVGQPLKLLCDYGKTYPKPVVSWQLTDAVDSPNSEVLPMSGRIQMDLDGHLHFMNIQNSDKQNNKIYKCTVLNPVLDLEAGGSYSKIDVQPGSPANTRPKLEYGPTDKVVALLGETITFKCLFSGYPTPRVRWSRKGGQLPPGRHEITESETRLSIRDIQWGDEGEYECSGYNTKDTVPNVFEIDVEAVPTFVKEDPGNDNSVERRPMNLNKTEEEDAVFYCTTNAEPDADIQWYINGDEIDSTNPGPKRSISDDETMLTVTDLCKDCADGSTDLIVVQCNASNDHGYAYSQGYLNVLERTILTVKPVDVNMVAWEDEVVFECDAESDDSTPVTIIWKHDGVQVDPNKQPEYELDGNNLKVFPMAEDDEEKRKEIEGKYTCEATNDYTTAMHDAYLTLPVVAAPKTAGFNILDYWWVFLIIVVIILIILLILLCYICYQRNKGDEYPVDEKDRKNGYDPEKELADSGFHDFQRPEEAPFKGSRASLTSTIKLDTDDEASLLEYGEPDTGKFNEDGSFIGQYHDKSRRYNDSTV